MNTIRELKQQEKYKSMLKRKNKEKKIYKDKNASLQLEKQRLYIALRNKDKEIERLNNIINELEKEIDRLLERQYESERFAKEQGFDTYLPAKENLLYVKNKLQELKGSDSNVKK